MYINNIQQVNFGSLILKAPALHFVDYQSQTIKNEFIQAQRELANTKYWDLEFLINQFKLIGKGKYEGFTISDVFKFSKDKSKRTILNASGNYSYTLDTGEILDVNFGKIILNNKQKNYTKYISNLDRVNQALELTKQLEKQRTKTQFMA